MTEPDALEQRLAESLHNHELPAEVPGLARRAERLGRRLRRRRRAGAVAGILAAALVVPGVAYVVTTSTDRSAPQPVGPITANPVTTTPAPTPVSSPTPSTRPRSPAPVVDIELSRLPRGGRPEVDVVVNGVWRRAAGGSTDLRLDPQTSAARFRHFGDGLLAAVWPLSSGPDLPLLVDAHGSSQALEHVSTPVVPGPDGSLVWLESRSSEHTLVQLDPGGGRRRLPLPPGTSSDAVVASARTTLFLTERDRVIRYGWSDSGLVDPFPVPGATGVLFASPTADLAVLLNADGCTAVVTATAPQPRAWECDYPVNSMSEDGHYRFGYSIAEEASVLTDAAGQVLLQLRDPADGDAVVDNSGSVTLLGYDPLPGDVANKVAVVRCDLVGHCHRATETATVELNSGERPIVLVQP